MGCQQGETETAALGVVPHLEVPLLPWWQKAARTPHRTAYLGEEAGDTLAEAGGGANGAEVMATVSAVVPLSDDSRIGETLSTERPAGEPIGVGLTPT